MDARHEQQRNSSSPELSFESPAEDTSVSAVFSALSALEALCDNVPDLR